VPHGVLVVVAIAVGLLLVAALASLFVNGSWKQGAVPLSALSGTIYQATWATVDAQQAIAAHDLRVDLVTKLRNANRRRAHLLMLALSLECAAVVLLAIGSLQILLRQN